MLGFEVLRLLRARVQGFAPWARQGSGFCAFWGEGSWFRALLGLGFMVWGSSGIRVHGFGQLCHNNFIFASLPKASSKLAPNLTTFTISGQGQPRSSFGARAHQGSRFFVLRARVRGFAPFARQGSRFCVFCGLGFEVLRLGRARVRGFAPFAR